MAGTWDVEFLGPKAPSPHVHGRGSAGLELGFLFFFFLLILPSFLKMGY